MPTRTRQIQPEPSDPTRTRKKRVRRSSWPFPPEVGSEIGAEFRQFHIPKDDYYYLSFPYTNSMEDTDNTLRLLRRKVLPFEYSRSPSGCVCYRLHRKHEKHPLVYSPPGPYTTVPVRLPYFQYGKEVSFIMHQQNTFDYLFKEWKPVLALVRRRKRTK